MPNPNTPGFYTALVLGGLIILFGPRKWMLPTFLILSVFVSMVPKIMIFGQHFMIHRNLLLCAWVRILARGEHRGLRLLPMDKAFVLFCVWTVIGDTLLWQTSHAMVYQVANSIYDALGIYFFCRIMINDAAEMKRIIVCLAGICVALAGFMCLEALTHHNWLSVLGQVQEVVQERKGRLRCQAGFGVPISAGTFGAVLLPLFVAGWWQGGRMRKLAVGGCIAATVVTILAGSGGPVMTYAAVVGGLLMWGLRHRMRTVRWTVCLALLGLHLVMSAPVWALIARIHVIPGSSSYHRYELLDAFIRHIGDWWMLGVQSTGTWGWLTDDVANQYCVVAKHGGILALILFLRVVMLGFREVGLRLNETAGDRPTQIMLWAFGVMLFAHCVAFFDISYFDQMKMLWFLSLAMLASLRLLTQAQEEPAEARVVAARGEFSIDAQAPVL